MTRRFAFVLLAVAALCGGSACSTSPSATAQSISVNQIVVGVGGSAQLVVSALMSDGTTANVTATVTLASANPAIATVSSTGLVTGIARGATTITVTLGTLATAAGVTVTS
jgi:hypothetical protein